MRLHRCPIVALQCVKNKNAPCHASDELLQHKERSSVRCLRHAGFIPSRREAYGSMNTLDPKQALALPTLAPVMKQMLRT